MNKEYVKTQLEFLFRLIASSAASKYYKLDKKESDALTTMMLYEGFMKALSLFIKEGPVMVQWKSIGVIQDLILLIQLP